VKGDGYLSPFYDLLFGKRIPRVKPYNFISNNQLAAHKFR